MKKQKNQDQQNTYTVAVGNRETSFDLVSTEAPVFEHESIVAKGDAVVRLAAFVHYPGLFQVVVVVFTQDEARKYTAYVPIPIDKGAKATVYEPVGDDDYEILVATKQGNYLFSFEAHHLVAIKANFAIEFYGN